jgi:hypothetical protein
MIDWTNADRAAVEAEGWDIFETTSEGHAPFEIERIDEAAVFPSDDEAWLHVCAQAKRPIAGRRHRKALAFLAAHAPEEYEAIRTYCTTS